MTEAQIAAANEQFFATTIVGILCRDDFAGAVLAAFQEFKVEFSQDGSGDDTMVMVDATPAMEAGLPLAMITRDVEDGILRFIADSLHGNAMSRVNRPDRGLSECVSGFAMNYKYQFKFTITGYLRPTMKGGQSAGEIIQNPCTLHTDDFCSRTVKLEIMVN